MAGKGMWPYQNFAYRRVRMSLLCNKSRTLCYVYTLHRESSNVVDA